MCTTVPRHQLGKSWSQKGHFRACCVLWTFQGGGMWTVGLKGKQHAGGEELIGVIFHVTLTLGVRSRLLSM